MFCENQIVLYIVEIVQIFKSCFTNSMLTKFTCYNEFKIWHPKSHCLYLKLIIKYTPMFVYSPLHKTLYLCLCLLVFSLSMTAQQRMLLKHDWQMQSSEKIKATGYEISSKVNNNQTWYPVDVPSTVMNALVKNNVYPDLFFGKNLEKVDLSQFEKSWWYKKEIMLDKPLDEGQYANLRFEGINYKANIWLNGVLIADTAQVVGVFSIFDFNVTKALKAGKNILAVEVFAPKAGDFTMGFVDWAPVPPDKNMGIWREVYLEINQQVGFKNLFVQSHFIDSKTDQDRFKKATLEISTELSNYTATPQTVTFSGTISPLHDVAIKPILISKTVTLLANETRKIVFDNNDFSTYIIDNPKLWWPNGLGNPNLYTITLLAEVNKVKADQETETFGIREVKDYFTPEGARGYSINGKKVLLKGAGWVDELFLGNDTRNNDAQVRYVKHMGLNTIRFEGFWGTSQELYKLCDQYGLFVMVGFSCQWEWHDYIGGKKFNEEEDGFGAIQTQEEMDLVANYFKDMTLWLRNRPSIIAWMGGSDRLHQPELEKRYLAIMKAENPQALYCGAAKMKQSVVTGSTGVKMEGPYDYVPPVYWFTDTKRGGAFGFNTETGPGPQPPVLESAKKMIPAENLWPIDTNLWNYHSGRHAFANMDRFTKPLDARYGKQNSIEDFCTKSQMQSYEVMRPMFEAFVLNKPKTTGIVQWMLNSAWPETYWQLYDYYLYPTGAFYGTKKANQPVLIAYHYGDKKVLVANETYNSYSGLSAQIKVFSSTSALVKVMTKNVDLAANAVQEIALLGDIADANKMYFIALTLVNKEGKVLSSNFYWVSTKADVMDPNVANASWIYTPTLADADMTFINQLPKTTLVAKHSIAKKATQTEVSVTLKNTGNHIAFFTELTLKGKSSKQWILPVFWDDNYISILPGETKSIKALVDNADLGNQEIEFEFSGVNLE